MADLFDVLSSFIPIYGSVKTGQEAYNRSGGDFFETAFGIAAPGAYRATSAATGDFGRDDAAAIDKAAKEQQAFLEQGRTGLAAAGQQARAGLDPYAQAGSQAVQAQQALAGLLGPEAQQQAIQQLQNSPQFAALLQQQEQGILANASATGGLRGGNTQQALATGRSDLLSALIEQQYARLGGLASAGQGAAAQQGAFGINGAGMQADLLGQQGQASAGSIIGQQQARNAGRDQAIQFGLQGAGLAASLFTGLPIGVGGAPQQQQIQPPQGAV